MHGVMHLCNERIQVIHRVIKRISTTYQQYPHVETVDKLLEIQVVHRLSTDIIKFNFWIFILTIYTQSYKQSYTQSEAKETLQLYGELNAYQQYQHSLL